MAQAGLGIFQFCMDSGALENTKMGIFFEGSHERCRWLEERENGNNTLVKEEEVPLIGWA